MFIEVKTITAKAGTSERVVEHFTGPGEIEKIPGFIDLSVLVKEKRKNDVTEEVMVLIRWDSKDAWKHWETSNAHIQGHRERRGAAQPDHIIGSEHATYEVRSSKGPWTVD
ncbi:antibiotic biosynthesis monooxygenase [Paenibacillus lemnae]|uniref:Antibiotic biosynthesis monooxygenase n=1 Tax=Paenibacillus lemnae TaxID=1330551 RepID=A0A848M5J3_PAELE|nr:antibiotic biosynthesis monooxygenase [Paenibacillus lemnae]